MEKASRTSGGSDRSVEHSPLHHHHAKASGVAPNTPGRFKTRDESPDRGPPVPKFGEWDESDPASADGFTDIFNKVREEKQTGAAKVPQITDDSMYLNSYGGRYKSSGCCCFSWCRK